MESPQRITPRELLKYLAVSALAFQMHLIEHVAQLGYWTAHHPLEASWMTPWAIEGRDIIATEGTWRWAMSSSI